MLPRRACGSRSAGRDRPTAVARGPHPRLFGRSWTAIFRRSRSAPRGFAQCASSSPRRNRPTSAATMAAAFCAGLPARARQVRGHDDVRRAQQPRVRRGSAPRGTRRTPRRTGGRSPGRRTRVVVDQGPARAVHEHRSRRHQGELRRADHPVFSGVTRACRVTKPERDSSSSSSTFFTPAPSASGVDIRVEDDDVRAEAAQHPCDAAADRPVADQPDGAVLQLGADQVVAVVVAAPDAAGEVARGCAGCGGSRPASSRPCARRWPSRCGPARR